MPRTPRRDSFVRTALVLAVLATAAASVPTAQRAAAIAPSLFQGMQWRNIGPVRGGRSIAASGVRRAAARGLLRRHRRRAVEDHRRRPDLEPGDRRADRQLIGRRGGGVGVAPRRRLHRDGRVAHPRQHHAGRRDLQVQRRRQDVDAASASRRPASPSRASASIRPTPTSSTSPSSATSSPTAPSAASTARGMAARAGSGCCTATTRAPASKSQIDAIDPNVVYASLWEAYRRSWQMSSGGPGSGLFKSTDAGDTWTEITRAKGLPAQGPIGKIGIAVSRADSKRLWVLLEHENGGLFMSDDAGASWALVNDDRNIRQRVVLLLARLRRPEEPRHGVDAERQHVPVGRRRQDADQRHRAARRLPRPVDRSRRPAASRQRQRRRRHGVDQLGRDLDRPRFPDRADLPARPHQRLPVLGVRRPAGQHHGLRAGAGGARRPRRRLLSRPAAARAAMSPRIRPRRTCSIRAARARSSPASTGPPGTSATSSPTRASSRASRRAICRNAGSGPSRSSSTRSTPTR